MKSLLSFCKQYFLSLNEPWVGIDWLLFDQLYQPLCSVQNQTTSGREKARLLLDIEAPNRVPVKHSRCDR